MKWGLADAFPGPPRQSCGSALCCPSNFAFHEFDSAADPAALLTCSSASGAPPHSVGFSIFHRTGAGVWLLHPFKSAIKSCALLASGPGFSLSFRGGVPDPRRRWGSARSAKYFLGYGLRNPTLGVSPPLGAPHPGVLKGSLFWARLEFAAKTGFRRHLRVWANRSTLCFGHRC